MHAALRPSMKALVAGDLLRHSDLDVKIAVASCLSEITRITAPDAPYDDDLMKVLLILLLKLLSECLYIIDAILSNYLGDFWTDCWCF